MKNRVIISMFFCILNVAVVFANTATPDERVKALGIVIPQMAAPAGDYLPYRISDKHIYISQIALKDGKVLSPGVLSTASDVPRGEEAARQTMLNILAVVQAACGGTLNCVDYVVRLDGYIASSQQFFDQAKIMNAASKVLVDIFGPAGLHARSAVGSIALPLNSAVEISAVIKLKE